MKQKTLSDGWRLRQSEPCEQLSREVLEEAASGGAEADWLTVEQMPLMVHDVLRAHGKIREPWQAGEALASGWVAENDWIYSVRFEVADPTAQTWLSFAGLDTIVDVYLNGEVVARHSNMYMPLRVDVTGRLVTHNVLALHFHTVFSDSKPMDRIGDQLVRRPNNNYGTYLGPHPLFSRVGVFDAVVLQTVEKGELRGVVAGASLDEGLQNGVATAHVTGVSTGPGQVVVRLLDPEDREVGREEAVLGQSGGFDINVSLPVSQPELWWPRGYGAQPVYRLETSLLVGGEKQHVMNRTLGFRRVTMPEPLHFHVNGRPVRLWGGDWVTPRWDTAVWDSERVHQLLDIAANGNFNVFRVWGVVESPRDEFYELCSRRGFLLWQDFTDLPLRPDPLARQACREEARHLVERLKHHPSIFFWCGCNEAAMWNDSEYHGPGGEWPGRIPAEEEVAPVCRELDPDRPFLPSSPYNGVDNNDPQVWNTHGYTNLWFVPGYDYLNFASEDTRIAAPPLKSLQKFFAPQDLWPAGYTQHVSHGVTLPWPETWEKYTFNSPRDPSGKKTGPVELFHDATDAEGLVYRLGMAEAHYYRDTIERQRRGRAAKDPNDRRRCGGYIVWKYNDSWPEIYSAKVDYFLEPYLPYYAIRRAYAPVLVSIDADAYVWIWVVNDTPEQVSGTLTVRLFHMDENTVTREVSHPVSVAADQSVPVLRLDQAGIASFRKEHVIFAELTDSQGELVARNNTLVDIDRRLVFPEAEIKVRIENGDLLLTTDRFARSVNLEGDARGDVFGWLFDDNWFDLLPGETKRVRVLGKHQAGQIIAGAWHSPRRTLVDWRR